MRFVQLLVFVAWEVIRIRYTFTMGWLTVDNENGNRNDIVEVNILTVEWLTIANENGNVYFLHAYRGMVHYF